MSVNDNPNTSPDLNALARSAAECIIPYKRDYDWPPGGALETVGMQIVLSLCYPLD